MALASECIRRIQELMEVAGDVEICIDIADNIYEPVCFELTSVRKIHGGPAGLFLYENTIKDNNQQIISIY